jgi:hypothetical protein
MQSRITLIAIAIFAITAPARGVTFGWQELPDGGIEYIVQVEPALLDAFRDTGYWSEIPAGTPAFRRIKLKVGDEKLPNEGTLPPPVVAPEPKQTVTEGNPMASGAEFSKPPDAPTREAPADFQQPAEAKPIYSGPFSGAFNRDQKLPAPEPIDEPAPTTKPDAETPPMTTKKPVLGETEPPSGTARPWMPLMLALVALFASIGANAYLVWIHQTLRINYRAVVARMKGDAASA